MKTIQDLRSCTAVALEMLIFSKHFLHNLTNDKNQTCNSDGSQYEYNIVRVELIACSTIAIM